MQTDDLIEQRLSEIEDRWRDTLGLLQDLIVSFRELAPLKAIEMFARYERDIAALKAEGAPEKMIRSQLTRFSWFANAAFPYTDDPEDPDPDQPAAA